MSSNQSFHEKELLFRLEADDTSAFDALYYHYEPRLRLFLYPFTGADESLLNAILQDVFVKLWVKRKDLTGIAFLEYYLQRMAKNRLLDLLKLRNIHEQHLAGYSRLQSETGDITGDQLQLKEYMNIARKGIAQLPERRRIIFSMSVLEGMSLDEIAEHLQISKDVVKKQLQKAKAFLKEYISKNGDLPLMISGWVVAALLS